MKIDYLRDGPEQLLNTNPYVVPIYDITLKEVLSLMNLA
jgi:hypothetical protein